MLPSRRLVRPWADDDFPMIHLGNICCLNYQWKTLIHLTMVWRNFTAWKVSKYRVIFVPYFPSFGLNTERYRVSLHIQPEFGKIRTRKNSVFGHFSHLNIYVSGCDNFAPRKKKYSWGNNAPLMNNAYKKIQMKRTRLRNSYLKKENVRKKLLMIGHRITIFPLQKTKRNYYANLNKKNVADRERSNQFYLTGLQLKR